MTLKCPQIESARFTCDREASYQVEGVVYCRIHARRLMELLANAERSTQ